MSRKILLQYDEDEVVVAGSSELFKLELVEEFEFELPFETGNRR